MELTFRIVGFASSDPGRFERDEEKQPKLSRTVHTRETRPSTATGADARVQPSYGAKLARLRGEKANLDASRSGMFRDRGKGMARAIPSGKRGNTIHPGGVC